MPRPKTDNVQITVVVSPGDLLACERIAEFISRPGFRALRNDGVRAALARGVASYLADMEAAEKASK